MRCSVAAFTVAVVLVGSVPGSDAGSPPTYEHRETREIVALVEAAADLVHAEGATAFAELAKPASRWRKEETYVFVLDLEGEMRLHPDPAIEGKRDLDLEDVDGRPILRGLLGAATASPGKTSGWYHYRWPVPGGLLPRWKSSYVRLVAAPSGERYVVGSGVYDDRMERSFVADAVANAVALIEKKGEAAFPALHDRKGPFRAKDAYVFVIDPSGVDLVNPAFPNLEGRNLLDVEDAAGKPIIRDMLAIVESRREGWIDYLWPKPGESRPTRKSAYVTRARIGERWLLVGSGVYLADAPKAAPVAAKMTAPELVALVREAAETLERRGEDAFPEFRRKGSKWLRGETYFFVWTIDGVRIFHGADPTIEGRDVTDLKDVIGRPIGVMFLEAAATPSGEGWAHYLYPEPGDLFPRWKSTFVKRVDFPSGKPHVVGCGIYGMEMDRTFVEDVVNRAAALVAERGEEAFARLRDETGPFVFMDTYVFVDRPDGTELVNAAQPSLEGRNLADLRDVNGKLVTREAIDAAMTHGSAWVDYHWYRPGENVPALKHAFVRKVEFEGKTYVVGSGFHPPGNASGMGGERGPD